MNPFSFTKLQEMIKGRASEEIVVLLAGKGLLNKDGLKNRAKLTALLNQIDEQIENERNARHQEHQLQEYIKENLDLFKAEIIFCDVVKDKLILIKKDDWRSYREKGYATAKRLMESDEYKREVEEYQRSIYYKPENLTNEDRSILDMIILYSTQIVPGEHWGFENSIEHIPRQKAEILLPFLTDKGLKLELGKGDRFQTWKKDFENSKIFEQNLKLIEELTQIEENSQNDEARSPRKWWQFWK